MPIKQIFKMSELDLPDNENKDKEILDNDINHDKEREEHAQRINQVKVIIFNILLPFIDLLVDITKSVMLIFDNQEFKSFSSFANHFHGNGIYGIISLLLKWAPVIVTMLHFQDISR